MIEQSFQITTFSRSVSCGSSLPQVCHWLRDLSPVLDIAMYQRNRFKAYRYKPESPIYQNIDMYLKSLQRTLRSVLSQNLPRGESYRVRLQAETFPLWEQTSLETKIQDIMAHDMMHTMPQSTVWRQNPLYLPRFSRYYTQTHYLNPPLIFNDKRLWRNLSGIYGKESGTETLHAIERAVENFCKGKMSLADSMELLRRVKAMKVFICHLSIRDANHIKESEVYCIVCILPYESNIAHEDRGTFSCKPSSNSS